MIEFVVLYFLIGIIFTTSAVIKNGGVGGIPLSGWFMCIIVWPYTLFLAVTK